jgi:hypothetical protein
MDPYSPICIHSVWPEPPPPAIAHLSDGAVVEAPDVGVAVALVAGDDIAPLALYVYIYTVWPYPPIIIIIIIIIIITTTTKRTCPMARWSKRHT